MALLGNVERVAVIGAQGDEGRCRPVQQRRQRIDILGHAAFADQHLHAFFQLFACLGKAGAFMAVADAAGGIGVELVTADQRAMAVDMIARERDQLVEHSIVMGKDAGEVHEFRQTDDRRVVAQGNEVIGGQPRAGGFKLGCGNTTRQLYPKVEGKLLRRIEEVTQALRAEHVGDFVRVADRGGGAVRQDATFKLVGRDQGAFNMQMRVDEAGDDHLVAGVDFTHAAIVVIGADDAVAADRDVAAINLAGRDIEKAPALQHQIGGRAAERLVNTP